MSRMTERLAKWRMVLAGWQLGTRADTDPECQAVRHHREATLFLRAEVTALTALLIERGVFTLADFEKQLDIEAAALDKAFEQKFPGFKATDIGISIDVKQAAETMKGWRP